MVDRLVAVDDADYRLPDPVLQAIAADVADVSTNIGSAVESRTFVIDTDYANLEDALTAVATGGVLEVRGAWSRSTTFTVNKPCTVRFNNNGAITVSSASVAAITVAANGVLLEYPKLIGTGAAVSGSGVGISATGTLASRLTGLRIVSPTISAFNQYGILLDFCDNFEVTDMAISTIGYAGIGMMSCSNGLVRGGSIRTITHPVAYPDSYGMFVSRRTNSAGELATYPRSTTITVTGVTIDGNPTWEGLDTHGGTDLTFSNNTILNCLVGIAIVSSKDNSNANAYSALDVTVEGNTIVGSDNGTNSAGIWFIGTPGEEATGSVRGNRVTGMGKDSSTPSNEWGAVVLAYTRGVKIENNRLVRTAVAGIHIINNNTRVSMAANTVEDVWSSVSGVCAAVYVRSTPNSLVVSGTQIVRGAKTATRVNNEGIRCNTTSTQTDGGGNQWTNAVTAAVNETALKASVLNAVPVARAAAITLVPAAPASYDQAHTQAMVTAINALIAVDKNYGLTL